MCCLPNSGLFVCMTLFIRQNILNGTLKTLHTHRSYLRPQRDNWRCCLPAGETLTEHRSSLWNLHSQVDHYYQQLLCHCHRCVQLVLITAGKAGGEKLSFLASAKKSVVETNIKQTICTNTVEKKKKEEIVPNFHFKIIDTERHGL